MNREVAVFGIFVICYDAYSTGLYNDLKLRV